MRKKFLIIGLLMAGFCVLKAQNNNNNQIAYSKTVLQQWTAGDLTVPIGSGGNRGYIINVYIGGGWAQLSASFEIHKTWGLNNFYVAKASYAYQDMRRRLRIWSKNIQVERAYITLTWINESPNKSYGNLLRADIIPIADNNGYNDDQVWNTNETTSFTGFTDISDNGLATYGTSSLSEMYGNLKVNSTGYNGLFINKDAAVDDNVHIRLTNNQSQTNISGEHRADIWLDNDGVLRLRNVTDKGIAIRNTYATTDLVRFTGDGSVGIGTTNPGPYKLAVEGTIGARKIKVTQVNPWADYVFKPHYHLRTLSEVEQYIKTHQHLPDVPNEQEVTTNGIDIGETQAMLLRKIEELTLYVIELQKQVNELKKKR